jgi:hypothetical protein
MVFLEVAAPVREINNTKGVRKCASGLESEM